MPSAAARRLYEDQIPSFMSVFDLGATAMDDRDAMTVVHPKIIDLATPGYDGPVPSCQAPPQPSSLPRSAAVVGAAPPSLPCDPSHRHHDSTSTQASESADSSPTTTMSCTDSSSLSDPSPSSSPDSPVNLVPLASLPGPSFGRVPNMSLGSVSPIATDRANRAGRSDRSDHGKSLVRPVTSPSPRRRNMKGLSIQPPLVSPGLCSLPSEPSSPSFIKPQIPAMKRKPSQLSLKTSTYDLLRSSSSYEVPPSPALSMASMPPMLQRRALKHSTSSPHMLSGLKSATFGPSGGMTIPTVLERNESGLSEFLRPSRPSRSSGSAGFDSTILEEESPIRTQIANRAAYEFEPYHEHENNEDLQTPGYPDGPIAIYGDNVFLYLEPTAEEASRFDVVINVAREVNNPFEDDIPPPEPAEPSAEGFPDAFPEPVLKPFGSFAESISKSFGAFPGPILKPFGTFSSTFPEPIPEDPVPAPIWTEQQKAEPEPEPEPEPESTLPAAPALLLPPQPTLSLTTADSDEPPRPLPEDNTPTTPKASSASLKEPEYIHIPWDHNTDIGEDLMMLCETIEAKTRAGKKVLIHCQQGASRSASLIIAYGLYQNPELTVNDAYYAAQAKSRWISPNMRLMYCLQDFQKEVAKKKLPPSASLHQRKGRSPTKHRTTLSADAVDASPRKEPLSAPLPAEDGSASGIGSASTSDSLHSPFKSPTRPRGNSTPMSRDGISPGPSSAPSAFTWTEKEDEKDPYKFGRFHLEPPVVLAPPPATATALPGTGVGMGLSRPKSSMGALGSTKPTRPVASLGGSFMMPPPSPMKPPPSPGFGAHRFGSFPRPSSRPGFSLFRTGLSPTESGPDPDRDHHSPLDSILCKRGSTQATSTTPPPMLRDHARHAYEPALPIRAAGAAMSALSVEEPLMSPRAETMTNNPLRRDPCGDFAGLRFVKVPPTPSASEGIFSPRETLFPRDPFFPFGRPTQVADPRSPPTKGETPIVRSIDELI